MNTDIAGEKYVVYDSVSHRVKHLCIGGVNYINTYLPTVDTTVEGRDRLETALGNLDEKLNPLKGEPVILARDMNLSSKHNPERQKMFRTFFERHNLKLHTPSVPTKLIALLPFTWNL